MVHINVRNGHYYDYDVFVIEEILKRQRNGKPITLKEKQAVKKYAEQQRIKNLIKKNNNRKK